jgi:MtN3 and saliva related transmembrane protein
MPPLAQEAIGWVSSLILVVTIAQQVYNQWKEGSSKGVSSWLFIGQLAASVGFVVYSALMKNWVFTTTNALMIVNALLGFSIVSYHRRKSRRAAR